MTSKSGKPRYEPWHQPLAEKRAEWSRLEENFQMFRAAAIKFDFSLCNWPLDQERRTYTGTNWLHQCGTFLLTPINSVTKLLQHSQQLKQRCVIINNQHASSFTIWLIAFILVMSIHAHRGWFFPAWRLADKFNVARQGWLWINEAIFLILVAGGFFPSAWSF